MKVLPHYKEDEGAKCSWSVSLLANVNFLSPEDAHLIFAYMESCAVIDGWLSNIRDPISGRFDIPAKTWSDGEYVWDSSHSHYVSRYAARLPEEFIEHVKRQVATGFDARTLDSAKLRADFERLLERLAAGDESFYASYRNSDGLSHF